MKRTTLALLLLVCLAAPSLPYSNTEIKKMFDQSVATRNLELRRSLREKIAQASPSSAYGIISRAYLLHAAGGLHPLQGVGMYSEAIKLNPRIAVAYYNRGLTYNELGEGEKAAADFTKVLELEPGHGDAYEARGQSYAMLGRKDLALADYNKALSLNPKDQAAYVNRGLLYKESKDYVKAIEDFSEVIRLNPGLYEPYLDRCVAYLDIKAYDKALKDCDKAVELQPENQMAYVTRGTLNIFMDRVDQAIADREKVVAIMPDNGYSWSDLCSAYAKAYELEKAVSACRRSVSLEPEYNMPYYNLCDAYVTSRQYNLAGETADYWLKKNPSDNYMLICKGEAAAAGGRPLEALKVFDTAIAAGADGFYMRIARADAYTDDGKFDLAKAEIETAQKKGVGIMPKLAAARIAYQSGSRKEAGMLFNNVLGDSTKASAFVRKVVEKNDGHYSEKWLADMKELLNEYDRTIKSAWGSKRGDAPEGAEAAAELPQDQCYCLYYTGGVPSYYISTFDPPKPGCENVKFKPNKLSPGITGLKSCPNQKKQGE